MVKPILFSTAMVRAILDGRKTATRRTIKGFIPDDAMWGYTAFTPKGYISCRGTFANVYGEKYFRLPCQPRDILYVREAWAFMECIACCGDYRRPENSPPCYGTQAVEYDDGDCISDGCFIYRAGCRTSGRITWRPSIHMPKEAARIWLKVLDVRVESLYDMTLDDFLAEGAALRPEAFNDPENAYLQARDIFRNIWDSTIPKAKLAQNGWDANPWVWVIKFERCEKLEVDDAWIGSYKPERGGCLC